MRSVYATVLGAGLLALAASPAFAQPPRPGGGGFGGGGPPSLERLLGNDKVQEEIKLTDDEKAAVKKAADTVNAKYKDDIDKARADMNREKVGELRKAMAADLDKAYADVLKPEQFKRLKQIQVQNSGLAAFSMDDVASALKLTDKQKDAVSQEERDLRDDVRDLFQGAQGDQAKMADAMKKAQSMREDSLKKVVEGLSADQQKTWKDLTGDKFEVALGPGGPGGFPGGPGGGFPGGGAFGGGGRGFGVGMLLQADKVKQELKLTDDQVKDAQAAADKVREKYQDELTKARQDMDQQKLGELRKEMTEDTEKALAGILKPEQSKRLKQIQVQVGGLFAFSTDDVQSALKLTDDQKKEVKDAQDALQKDMRETMQSAFQGGFSPDKMAEAGKKVQALQADAVDKVVKGLSDEQKKTWKDLTGEKFELDLMSLFPRPGGPGGRPNPDR